MAHTISINVDLGKLKTTAAAEIWKWGQVNKDDANYQRIYHLQYGEENNGGNVDKKLLELYLKQRAERIADIVSEYLDHVIFGDAVMAEDPNSQPIDPFAPAQRSTAPDNVMYELTLPGGWNPRTYQNLAKLFEDYVVNGAVAEWFSNVGNEQGAIYEQKASQMAVGILKNIYHKNSMI